MMGTGENTLSGTGSIPVNPLRRNHSGYGTTKGTTMGKGKWIAFAAKTVAKGVFLGGGMEGLPSAMIASDVTDKIIAEGKKKGGDKK